MVAGAAASAAALMTVQRGRRDTRLRQTVQRWIMAVHRSAYRSSKGRIGGRIGPNRVAILTTIGRKSSRRRSAPVFTYKDGADFIVVGSNGGTATPPEAWLEVGAKRVHVRAGILGGNERGSWWDRVTTDYPSYRVYQERTDPTIPVVRLARIDEDH